MKNLRRVPSGSRNAATILLNCCVAAAPARKISVRRRLALTNVYWELLRKSVAIASQSPPGNWQLTSGWPELTLLPTLIVTSAKNSCALRTAGQLTSKWLLEPAKLPLKVKRRLSVTPAGMLKGLLVQARKLVLRPQNLTHGRMFLPMSANGTST